MRLRRLLVGYGTGIRLVWFVSLVAVISCVSTRAGLDFGAATTPPRTDSGFTVRRLAEGVYAITRNEPLGLINESNSLFIIGDRDVVVVDAQSSSKRTLETLAALRRLTDKPVSALINTHWHDDHVVGNEVYKAAFPQLEIIGYSTSAEDMSTMGVAFRKGAAAATRAGTIAFLKSLVDKKQSFLGGPIDVEESRSHQLSAWLTEDYSNGSAEFRPLPPTRTVTDSLTLEQGDRRIQILFPGRAHTRGDLVVFLPRERILATGDALMWPVEFMGSTSFPGDYAAMEERIRALRPALVVPGHGKVLTGDEADAQATLIGRTGRALAEQARAAVAKGETLADAKKHIDLFAERQQMAGTSRLRQVLFSYYVNDAGFARAFELESARVKGGSHGTHESP